MKVVQTLYSYNEADLLTNNFGWISPQYHLMSWALSCLQLTKYYQQVSLYADKISADMLINVLGLPYHNVHITDDDFTMPHESLWALPKIHTYSLQSESFLHVDGDVFIFQAFQEHLSRSELIAQNQEEATAEYYTATQKQLLANFTYFPECVKRDFEKPIPITMANAGILGGSSIDFFKEYYAQTLEYINRNVENLSSINTDRFNVFFEQHLFYCLAKEKGIPISFFFTDVVNDNEYKKLAEFHETPCSKKYLHLLGHYKRDEYTCERLAEKLRNLYPDYYYKIIELWKAKGKFHSLKNFYANQFSTYREFEIFNKNATEAYNDKQAENLCLERKPQTPINFDDVLDLKYLNNYITDMASSKNLNIDLNSLLEDFDIFSKHIITFLNHPFLNIYLYGRDLESAGWYCTLFKDTENIKNMEIVCCKEVCVIESNYDWAGLLNKYKSVSISYYQNLEIIQGQYFNLIVPEISHYRISMFDINEIEQIILEKLSLPMTIEALCLVMQVFFEDDVIANHRSVFENFIIELVKALVSKKAIRPF